MYAWCDVHSSCTHHLHASLTSGVETLHLVPSQLHTEEVQVCGHCNDVGRGLIANDLAFMLSQ